MSQEIWKDVVWYEWLYQVSNMGNVKSLKNGRWWIWKERILKFTLNFWYSHIRIFKNNKGKTFRIHRLVAQVFIPNLENKLEVNHKNWIRDDNRVENLEWCTSSENKIHKFRVLWYKSWNFWKKWRLSKLSKKVNQYSLRWLFITTWDSIREASNATDISTRSIIDCCKNRKKSVWKYKREYNKNNICPEKNIVYFCKKN